MNATGTQRLEIRDATRNITNTEMHNAFINLSRQPNLTPIQADLALQGIEEIIEEQKLTSHQHRRAQKHKERISRRLRQLNGPGDRTISRTRRQDWKTN